MGAYNASYSAANDGSVFVVYGNFSTSTGALATLTNASANYNVRFDGGAGSDHLGYALAAGNLYGDSFDTLAIGANNAGHAHPASDGSVYVINDGATNFPAGTGNNRTLSNASFYTERFDGATAGDQLGSALAIG